MSNLNSSPIPRRSLLGGILAAIGTGCRSAVAIGSQVDKEQRPATEPRTAKGVDAPHLENAGMRRKSVAEIRRLLAQPQGMLLCCAPTFSGRTDSFCACLQEIDRRQRTVVTVEDSIAYRLNEIKQIKIDGKRGQTYAGALPSIVQQHPDVLGIGEIRDRETATIACQAAISRQMVVATIQAGDTAAAIHRLLELAVEPKPVASALSAVLCQRFVRLLCEECKEPYRPSAEFLKKANLPADKIDVFFRRPENPTQICPQCQGLGYLGRMSIYELLVLTEPARQLIRDNADAKAVKAEARKNGMANIEEDGLFRVIQGKTSLQELIRALN